MNKDETTQPGKDPNIPDNLQYAAAEDIYNQDERVSMDDEGNIISKENAEVSEIEEAMIGSDLDVPGSELDDENEIIGEEDEENNYYSLGGDNHEDLEEDNN
mgnify:CR=1 FL=1